METSKESGNLEKEIKELRNNLDKINKKKEEAFVKKEESRKELQKLIKKIKDINSTKKQSTSSIEKLKEKRDEHNKIVHQLIQEAKIFNQEKNKVFAQGNAQKDFLNIKKDIEKLEFKIETEAFSPSEEKKVMRQIKELKKKYDSAGESIMILEKANHLSKKIEAEKKIADNFHKELQTTLKSSTDYSDFKNVSKEINALRNKQEKEFKEFLTLKKECQNISKNLKEKLILKGEKRGLEKRVQKKREQKKKKHDGAILKEKTQQVEEKIKKGQKLTTEDLMVLQSNQS